MQILVTGANGFLGSAIVRAGQASGLGVVAGMRPGRAPATAGSDRELEIRELELAPGPALVAALEGIDLVIHAAAAMSGDVAAQHAGTVKTTEALLAAMQTAGVRRLVGISSFALYDYTALQAGSTLDEASPVESEPRRRDAYAQAKWHQEQLFRSFAEAGHAVAILRPGVIYGRDRLWPMCIGRSLGSGRLLRIGPPDAAVPMIHVDHCAQAIVQAAQRVDTLDGTPINLVDDPCPTRRGYIEAVNQHPAVSRLILPLPLGLLKCTGAVLTGLQATLGAPARLPGLLRPVDLDASFKPLRYSNARARQQLDWSPAFTLAEAIARSV